MTSARTCAFCDNPAKLTREHIYGQWLKSFAQSPYPKTEHITSLRRIDPDTGTNINSVGRGKLNRPGKPYSHQLRIVCESCNNTWMSAIQEEAKDRLIPLINGNWPKLNEIALKAISSYATMVTMVIEFADLNTLTTSLESRKLFKNSREPNTNWQILVGLCNNIDEQTGAFWHRGGKLLFSEEGQVTDKPNAQTTTFILGKCFIYTISGPIQFLMPPLEYASHLGIRLFWPLLDAEPKRPLVFTKDGVNRVATNTTLADF